MPLADTVVLVAIDLLGRAIQLVIHLDPFRLRQFATIGLAVGANLLGDRRFLGFEIRSFAGGQLSAVDALRDAVLLVFQALVNGWRLRDGRRGIGLDRVGCGLRHRG